VRTAWRADLPLVLPDGTIATATGDDVSLVDGGSLRERAAVRGGASDFWYVVLWNGFRPRAVCRACLVGNCFSGVEDPTPHDPFTPLPGQAFPGL